MMLKRSLWLAGGCLWAMTSLAQPTFPLNDVSAPPNGVFALTHATVVKNAASTLTDATLIIRDGRIAALGSGISIPADAQVIDCKGKTIYPSFIDIYSSYGIPAKQGGRPFDFRGPAQLETNIKSAYGWNQALHPEMEAQTVFEPNDANARKLREAGFGAVLTHSNDGIAQGTGSVVSLANDRANMVILKPKAAAHYSFSKGSSTQTYPSSLMGTIALLRQTYLDAAWYKSRPAAEGINLTLQAWNETQGLPQIMDAVGNSEDFWNVMRADRIGDEFGVQYILRASGKEYQRIREAMATKAPMIVSLSFPATQNLDDPNEARYVSLADMKHWEMAPSNPAALAKAGIPFALTMTGVSDGRTFMTNLRKAMEYGLSEATALDALTKTPATLLGVYDQVGSLEVGKLANLLITNGNVFEANTTIHHNWVQGKPYRIKTDNWDNVAGMYRLTVVGPQGQQQYNLDVKSTSSATATMGTDTLTTKLTTTGKTVKLGLSPKAKKGSSAAGISLSGFNQGELWQGTGADSNGVALTWMAVRQTTAEAKVDSAKKKEAPTMGAVTYPLGAYGWSNAPQQETILFKNATVWTSEKDGILSGTDVLVKQGKIAAVGKNLPAAGARVIDATGKHLTAGIIDEHSHIAASSINEGGQSVTSEVRIQDNLDPDDINIYRQLSGGVTTSHILHGSANTIGGQTQLIKLRWGVSDTGLIFRGADPFIKFALGENVKRTASTSGNNRFPDTRMGVEQVLIDAFTRAKDYEAAMKKGKVRRDLELDALVEIMNQKRFITCHSYVASEIANTMRVAERFGFKVNTFTHILEGYKVADRMKEHGANASSFSDWWAYKLEVQDAIPYSPYLMTRVGLNVAINSDDAEMARRLNQEAAKAVKYGGLTEEEAMNMVTINPAKMLHVDQKVGSIKTGKDADLVLWSDNPLSIYAKSLYTVVDGIVYFDREKDVTMRQDLRAERLRLMRKMQGIRAGGAPSVPASPSYRLAHTCGDHHHKMGMLELHDHSEGIESH